MERGLFIWGADVPSSTCGPCWGGPASEEHEMSETEAPAVDFEGVPAGEALVDDLRRAFLSVDPEVAERQLERVLQATALVPATS
jgi:hypothetical protein